jgi:tetratricopeptide (TPR) repeat protein
MRLTFIGLAIFAQSSTAVCQAALSPPAPIAHCSPDTSMSAGTTGYVFKCDRPAVDGVVYVVNDMEASALSTYYGISNTVLHNILSELGERKVQPHEVHDQLKHSINHTKALELRLAGVRVDGQQIEARWSELLRLVQEGNLSDADLLFEEIRQLAGSERSAIFKGARDPVLVDIAHADLKALRHDYDGAAKIYQKAVVELPATELPLTPEVKVSLAEALARGSADQATADKAIGEAVAATEPLSKIEPVLRMRALREYMTRLVETKKLKQATSVFESQIKPLFQLPGVAYTSEALFCYACVGRAYINAKLYDEALTILTEGEALTQKLSEPNPEGLSAIYQNTWLALMMQGRRAEAKQALDKSESMLRQAAPNEMHPNFVQTYLSKSVHATTNEETLKFTKRAFIIATEVYTPTNGQYNTALSMMGKAAAAVIAEQPTATERSAALADLDETYRLHQKKIAAYYGQDGWQQLAEGSAWFGQFTVSVDTRAALRYYKQCAELAVSHAVRSPGAAYCLFNAAQLVESAKLGTFAEAEPLYSAALEMYNEVIGVDSPQTQDVRIKFVKAYLGAKQPVKAEQLAKLLADRLTAEADFPRRAAYIKDLNGLAETAKADGADSR